jgi:hypothetical protein
LNGRRIQRRGPATSNLSIHCDGILPSIPFGFELPCHLLRKTARVPYFGAKLQPQREDPGDDRERDGGEPERDQNRRAAKGVVNEKVTLELPSESSGRGGASRRSVLVKLRDRVGVSASALNLGSDHVDVMVTRTEPHESQVGAARPADKVVLNELRFYHGRAEALDG